MTEPDVGIDALRELTLNLRWAWHHGTDELWAELDPELWAEWRLVIDTGRESPDDIREPGQEVRLTSARYTVGPRSVVVLLQPRRS